MCKKVVASGVILNEKGRILLSKKRDSGLYCPPGGKVEASELVVDALVRELQEEIGVTVVEPLLIGHCDLPDKVIFFYRITRWLGKITNMEPDKHGNWQWHEEIPSDRLIVEGLRIFRAELWQSMYNQWSMPA